MGVSGVEGFSGVRGFQGCGFQGWGEFPGMGAQRISHPEHRTPSEAAGAARDLQMLEDRIHLTQNGGTEQDDEGQRRQGPCGWPDQHPCVPAQVTAGSWRPSPPSP